MFHRCVIASCFVLAALSSPIAAQDSTADSPIVSTLSSASDWSGSYGGVQFGLGRASNRGGPVSGIGGLTLGYDRDLGTTVVGAAIDYDFAGVAVGGGFSFDSILRLKTRVGADLGDGLAYATGGAAWATGPGIGSDTGYFLGLGYDHRLTDQITLGGEVLYNRFEDFNDSGRDLSTTTAQMRAMFRF